MNIQVAAERILTPHELIELIFLDYESRDDIIKLNMAIYGVSQKNIFIGGNFVGGLIGINNEFEKIYDKVCIEDFGKDLYDSFETDDPEASDFSDFMRKGNQLRMTYDITGVDRDTNRKRTVRHYVFYNIVGDKLVYDRYEYRRPR
jgi:hypothetical protein